MAGSSANVLARLAVLAYTCPLVALAIAHCGLNAVLCDLRPDHFDMCLQTLERSCGGDTLAIVPTHLGGRLADVAGVKKIAQGVGATVIEDAAQSLGATWQGQPAGTLGDIGFYSLAVGKGLTLYEGGVLVTRDAAWRERMRTVAQQLAPRRLAWELRRLLELAGYRALYHPAGLRLAYGWPLRRALRKGRLIEAVGDDFPAHTPMHRVGAWRRTIGANALSRLPSFLEKISSQAATRKARLAAIGGIRVMDDPENGIGTWPYFMVLMPSVQARDAVMAQMWHSGLGVSRLFIHALPDYPYLAGRLGNTNVPNARDFAARLLTVSNSPWMRETDFLRICSALAEHA